MGEADELSAKERESTMAVERHALAHRGHVRRVYVVIAIGVATMVFAFVLLVFQPLSGCLRQQYRREVSHFPDTGSLLFQHTLELHNGLAWQVASQTVIRNALADYDADVSTWHARAR